MVRGAFSDDLDDDEDEAEELRRLEAAMVETPRGAIVVSGIATGLLILSWLLVYTFVFLPRGTVG
jgi:hypothetical protein